jgi:CheY-like chemotaxis protein
MSTKHILLVEDDARDADLTLAALEDYSVSNEIVVVHDGQEALDYLYCRGKFKTRERCYPVVVLLDNKMPKVSGLEVLKTLKSDEHLKAIPVVVLTSSRETRDLIEFYRNGVNAYVVKPVVFSDFISTVKQLGAFWAAVNEPPPYRELEETLHVNGAPNTKRPLK